MSGKIVVIAGPTASGKTRLGIELAHVLGGEIVSADSMQVYRGMDIGTAKADERDRALAVHHMLDVADPAENYSAARYVREAGAVCDALLEKGVTPIVVGGTGLYIDSLIAGRDFAENEDDNALRRALEAEYDAVGGEEMLLRLAAFDPERAARLQPGDRRRIVRAIEIYRLTGVTATAHDEETRRRPPRYDAARIVLGYKDRADLYARIDRRVTAMAEAGP
ncbi:MAG: tRNA (adenosine(37)-N6)-dimethylallyltransferase MiaA, partial [Eubacteriales bacterium]|nr:tRNA (adenosine(37)-N6)-dimethylallyltransferase MiaA [Eubacteriales bacterium]